MQLFLVRHAIAAPSTPERPDATRALTSGGRDKFIQATRGAKALGWRFDHLYHSPLTRAVQTAEILVTELGLGSPAVQVEALAEGPDLVQLADDIGDPASDASVALVGHSPWMEELAALLLAGSAAELRVDFPKSGVMGIDLERVAQGAGELRFFLRPKMV